MPTDAPVPAEPMRRVPWPGEPPSDRERATVALQLGRDPRGEIAIAGRCRYGLPGVVRTAPRLDDGTPFPTLFYLTCPVAVRNAGRLEAGGTMRALERRLAEDEALRDAYRRAHERYLALRDGAGGLDERPSAAGVPERASAGGMPDRVKCLHALYAHEVADGNPVGALVRDEVDPTECPGPCVQDDDDGLRRAPGHPGYAGKKRRR